MKKFFLFVIACFSLLCSCDNEEEKNPDIEWQFDKPYSSKYHFEVPAGGDTYSMLCKNYSRVNVDIIKEKDTTILFPAEPETSLKRDWYTIDIVKNKTIKVTFKSNDSAQDRSLIINTVAYNAGDEISFVQKGK